MILYKVCNAKRQTRQLALKITIFLDPKGCDQPISFRPLPAKVSPQLGRSSGQLQSVFGITMLRQGLQQTYAKSTNTINGIMVPESLNNCINLK